MDAPVSEPEVLRRGHSVASSRSGLHTFLFFGLIVFVVAAAGLLAITAWGPEKTVKNRTQFATNPPAPTVLPSLPPSADAPPPAEAASAAESEPTGAVPVATTSAPAKKSKKAKSAPRPTKH